MPAAAATGGAQQQQQPSQQLAHQADASNRLARPGKIRLKLSKVSSSGSSPAGPDSNSCAGFLNSSSSRGGSSSAGTNCQALQPLDGLLGSLTVVDSGSTDNSSSAANDAQPSTGILVDGSGSLPPTAAEAAAASSCSSFPKLPAEGLVLQSTGPISVTIGSQVLACSSCCVVYSSTASQVGRGQIPTVTKLYESSERGRAAQQHEAAVSAAIRAARSCNGSSLRDHYLWVVPGAPSTATIAGVEHPCTVLAFWGSSILELLQEFPKGVDPEVVKAFVRQLLQVLVLHDRVDPGFLHTGLGAQSVFAYQLGKDSAIRIGGFSGCRLASDPVAIRRGTRSSQRQVIKAQAAAAQRQGQVMGVARLLVDMLTGGGYTQRASSSSGASSSDASSSNNSSSRGYAQLTSRRRSAPGSYRGAFTELASRVCGSSSSSNTTSRNAGSGSGTSSSSSSHHAGSGRVSYRHDVMEEFLRTGGDSKRLPKLWQAPAMRAAHGFVLRCLKQKDSEPLVTAAGLLEDNWLKPAATNSSSKAGAKRGLEEPPSDATMEAAGEGDDNDDASSSMTAPAGTAAAAAAGAGQEQEQQQEAAAAGNQLGAQPLAEQPLASSHANGGRAAQALPPRQKSAATSGRPPKRPRLGGSFDENQAP
jgi:hypothetical protein